MIRSDAQKKKMRTNEYMFEYENNNKGHNVNIYEFKQFIKTVRNNYLYSTPMFNHEVLYPDRECKLYMDCELVGTETPALDLYVSTIHEQVVLRLEETENYEIKLLKPQVISAIRTNKFSVHLIWDIWFKSPSHVLEFLKPIVEKNLFSVTIDVQVYPTNSAAKCLRMCWSGKVSCNSDCILKPYPKCESEDLDIPKFIDSLVTFDILNYDPENTSHKRVYVKETNIKKFENATFNVCNTEMSIYKYNIITRWLSLISPVFNAQGLCTKNDDSIYFITTFYCGTSKKWHNKNLTYISDNINGSIENCCTDQECRIKKKFDFSLFDLETSEHKLVLDWKFLHQVVTYNKAKNIKN
jgi:hypothetical protein